LNPKLQEVTASSTNGGINTNPNSTIDNGGVDLDQLFNFLSGEVTGSMRSESVRSEFSSVRSSTGESSNEKEASILDEIDRQMSDLQNEIDLYSLRSNSINQEGQRTPENDPREEDDEMTPPPPPEFARNSREPSPPPLPPPCNATTPGTTPPTSSMHMLSKPSLPEPEGPPPPPPVQNGYAFNTPHISQEVRKPLKSQKPQIKCNTKPKEPIYESIKPRPEPLGGPGGQVNGGNDNDEEEYGFACQVNQFTAKNQQTPLKPLSTNIPNGVEGEYQSGIYNSKDSQYGFTGNNGIYGSSGGRQRPRASAALEAEREARRMVRVRRELERIQELNEDENKENDGIPEETEISHDMIEFAENYFNDHEKSPQGTIVGTLKRGKSTEMLPKSEMISFYKGTSIPNSHIHLFDPENVNIACNTFKDLYKFAKGEFSKGNESEVGIIQNVICNGLEREELRDEIYVQCCRQITNNPNQEQADRLWLLLCLVVVAFPPGKTFFKVTYIIRYSCTYIIL
jgi:hypothetical protein